MNEKEREFLRDSLIEANRSLLEHSILDPDVQPPFKDIAINDCLIAHTQLLRCQLMPLSPTESANVRGVLERLKALLKYFGETV
ncbi:MAG TPA: hypothetical protein VHZ09_19365 [Acidobacteriaceae bacterium]|jgi:hypothetical protein|nr:hypothetical protein [Acidobacteriaceae bacterium]